MAARVPPCLVSALLLLILPAATPPPAQSFGLWSNPSGSVHVRAHRCGPSMCGTIVWANDKAQADARRGGTDPLIGAQLFRDFRRDEKGGWRGKVFVPDIGKTFSGSIRLLDENRLEGKGCLVGGLACRSQIWTRIDG